MGRVDFSRSEAQPPPHQKQSPPAAANATASGPAIFFFDLEPVLSSKLTPNAYAKTRQKIEEGLQQVIRRQDRAIWGVTGFFLLIHADERSHATAVAVRVWQALVSAFRNVSADSLAEKIRYVHLSSFDATTKEFTGRAKS